MKRVPVLETFSWQAPIIDKDLIVPPASPAKGNRYIVAIGGEDDWLGKDNNIAWYDGSVWRFDVPSEGWICHVLDEDAFYKFSGTVWESYALHTHANKAILDLVEESFTTVLKASYDDAVAKTHEHPNKIVLDNIQEAFTTALKTAYDDAAVKAHAHTNKAILDAIEQAFTTVLKTKLDSVEAGAVALSTVKADVDIADAIIKKHEHNNKAILDSIDVAFTTALKAAYDEAYDKRAKYDEDLGCIIFDI